jgi:hypothetical protein
MPWVFANAPLFGSEAPYVAVDHISHLPEETACTGTARQRYIGPRRACRRTDIYRTIGFGDRLVRQTLQRTRKPAKRTPPVRTYAEQTIARRSMLVLTARETEAFANAILNPPKPGVVLRKAAREYRRKLA